MKATKSIDTTINDHLLELYRQKPDYRDPIFHPVIRQIHDVLYRKDAPAWPEVRYPYPGVYRIFRFGGSMSGLHVSTVKIGMAHSLTINRRMAGYLYNYGHYWEERLQGYGVYISDRRACQIFEKILHGWHNEEAREYSYSFDDDNPAHILR